MWTFCCSSRHSFFNCLFTAAGSCSNQNLKYEKFTSSFGSLRRKIASKSVLHVDRNYCCCFFISSHISRALRKKTTMSASITPVVQAIERKETRSKTRFFSATTATLSFICMTIINNTALQKREKHDNYCHLSVSFTRVVFASFIVISFLYPCLPIRGHYRFISSCFEMRDKLIWPYRSIG